MSEYISREAVEQIIAAQCGECDDACLEFDGIQPDCNQCLLYGAKKAIESIPAADVRPVVCCKDCVYAYPYGLEIKCTKHSGKAERLGEDATYSEFHSENWYCADAQRKREKRGED